MKNLLTKNLGWKAGSLALSSLIWLGLAVDPTAATTATVSVQYRNLPRDLDLSSLSVERVQLEVQGSSNSLKPDNLAGISAVLDMESVKSPGEHTFNFREENIKLPVGVSLIRAVPSQIRLTFEKHMERSVPIVLRYNGAIEGYELVSQRLEPAKLTVQGPESSVERVVSVETDAIQLRPQSGEQVISARAFVGDPRVRFAGDNHVVAHVTLRPVSKE